MEVGVFIKEQNEESPLQSVTVDGVGFFDFMPLSPLLEVTIAFKLLLFFDCFLICRGAI